MTAPTLSPADLPGWPRLLSITLAAAYVGHSVNAFRADIGKIWPQPVTGTRRKVWDREAIDQAIERMPGAVVAGSPKTSEEILDEARDVRKEAWVKEQKRREQRIAKKWADAKWEDKP